MDFENDITKSITRIEEKLDGVIVTMNEIVSAWPYISKRVDRIEKHLYGNGSAGLLVKVNALIYGIVSVSAAVGVLVSNMISKWLGV